MVDATVGRRIERWLARCCRDYAVDHAAVFPHHGAEVMKVGDSGAVAVWGSAHGAPNVSRALALGVAGEVRAEDLSHVEDFYARHGAGVTLVASPWTHPSLFGLLAAGGYRVAGFDNVLVRSIAPGDQLAPSLADPSLVVTRVARGGGVPWGRVVREASAGGPDDGRGAEIDAVFDVSKTAAMFLATIAGQPAGGGAVVVSEGMCYLLAAGTLPAFRRRGVQAALVGARLSHARDEGAGLAIVVTEPGSDSQRNLEARFGFHVAYTQVIFEGPSPRR